MYSLSFIPRDLTPKMIGGPDINILWRVLWGREGIFFTYNGEDNCQYEPFLVLKNIVMYVILR